MNEVKHTGKFDIENELSLIENSLRLLEVQINLLSRGSGITSSIALYRYIMGTLFERQAVLKSQQVTR